MKTYSIKYVIHRPLAEDDPRRQEGYTHEEPHYTIESGASRKSARLTFQSLCENETVVSATLFCNTYGEDTPKVISEYHNPRY